MNITKALYHLFEHAHRLGWREALHVIRVKKKGAGALQEVHATWLGGAVKVRPATADMATIDQFLLGPYMPTTIGHPPATIVDCGANIGLASRYLKQAFPQARIIAIEPDQENFALLSDNLKGLQDCHPVLAAVWPVPGFVQLERDGLRHSAFRTKASNGSGDTIEALSIPAIMERFGLDRIGLLKIDIEGAEMELFSAPDLSWLDQVDSIAIELHDLFKPGCGNAFFKAMAKTDRTYRVYGEVIYCERISGEATTRPSPIATSEMANGSILH